jgi:hypothetical protein
MMKSKEVQLGRSIALSILFFTAMISLLGSERGQESTWNDIHIWSGSLMLIGAVVHLINNWDWVKAIFSHPARELKQRLRRLRRTNLWLFVFGSLCAITGLVWMLPWLSPAVVERWAGLHRLSGILMSTLLGVHLLMHWRWLVNTLKGMNKPRQIDTAKGALTSQNQ